MGFFRNPEIRNALIIAVALTAVFSAAGFLVNISAGSLVLALGLSLCIIFTRATKKRYDYISRLSETIDGILHNEEVAILNDNREGELAILESEVHKMTIKLREQAFALQKEKIYLTDSIADISHQLRTPLTTINIVMSFLQKDDLDDRERKKHLKSINQNLARIDWLISSLLKMSKIDAGTADFKREKVRLSDVVDKAAGPLLIPMELREQVFEYSSKGEESFEGDINWTQEAVGNIIKNCMEHTPRGGHIRVCGSENDLYTQLVVQDNGSGISKKDMPHLFERFYSGSDSSESSVGIGLAMARMILMEQNGTVKAENDPDGGAKFTIKLYKKEKLLK
ncbi:MAG: HAMP domain-containing sensor histidine kinase [Eubacteriaceae bacterium]|nr:HAMP domain-containing sensor histidine kinase [Eubacteriaceae bacterium]